MGYTAQFATILLSINNGVNSLSRLGMGVLADYAGRQNTLIVSLFGSAMCVLGLWMGATHGEGVKELWLAFVVAYGILGGGFNALFPTTVSDIFGIDEYPSVNGFLYFVRGLGAFGSPVGGRILGDSTKVGPGYDVATALAKWRGLIWYDGALLMFSTLCVMGVRWFDAKEKGKWKWKA
ncbi:MAG: hypothetical protein M1829_002472 [Trizodia sp. TS-e1964]|nr:MAG: hypothetical protein M1829_002472 [Trizodia sp. TS-e1964]